MLHALAYDFYASMQAGASALTCAAIYAFKSPIDPSKPLLITPKEFFCAVLLLVLGIMSFVTTQHYQRRLLQAQLLYVADQVRCEKERLQYDFIFLQHKYKRARFARSEDSDDDGSTQSAQVATTRGQRPRRLPDSKSSVCSSGMVSIVDAVAELSRLRSEITQEDSQEPPPQPGQYTNDDRDQALWYTLDMQGIVPH